MGVQEEKKIEFEEAEEDKIYQETTTSTDVGVDKKIIVPHHKAVATIPTSDKCSEEVSIDRDAVLARVEQEKRLALIKAWEDSEKAKTDNKALKKLSGITSWENCKKAAVEATLRKKEEKLEKLKANYAEKMKNKLVDIHKVAEEKWASVEARRGEEVFKAEKEAAKYRTAGTTPRKFLGCFS